MAEFPSTTFEVDWLPFFLNPGQTQKIPLAEYLNSKFGLPLSAFASKTNPLILSGSKVGINFCTDRCIVPTINSHRLVEIARKSGKQDAAVEKIFHLYFEEGKDISDPQVLSGIARELQLPVDAEYFSGNQDRAEVFEQAKKLSSAHRIHGVPYFIISSGKSNKKICLEGAQPKEGFLDAFGSLLE